ncbi:MAG: ParB/RepB/Spo0J family partition protein [Chloroherpetonaceae bacterium]|nr:ParB/RepB/Spo0J family partition protein [Chloroherpetonaceae bacterium]MDW8436641.1 ParB/RepB/Spo0J family partition protein [Chloroherpetonaceae bacterium]
MAAKLVLGKGLGALIADKAIEIEELPSSDEQSATHRRFRNVQTGEVGTIGLLPIAQIAPNPFQPRMDFDPEALKELKESIMQKGVVQPITVRRKPDGNGYELISGERRLRAATDAGFTEIPAYVLDVKTNRDMIEIALIENIQRKNLNPIEIARGYQRLADECGLTQEEIAQRVNKDRATVANFIRLLKLPPEIQESIRNESVSMGHARALLSVEDPESQLNLWKLIIEQQLSVRRVEEIANKINKQKKKSVKKKEGKSAPEKILDIAEAESALRNKLGTKVKIRRSKKGSGEIVIEYYGEEDLERILDIIVNSEP